MRITVHETHVTAAGIADVRPVGVLAPAPVRPSATRSAHAALTRSRSTGPAMHRRALANPNRRRALEPAVTSGDTVLATVARPPYRGAGGGPRARPATTH